MIPPLSLDFASRSGVTGDTGSSAVSGGQAAPVVLDDFTKWAMLGTLALVGIVLVVRLAK